MIKSFKYDNNDERLYVQLGEKLGAFGNLETEM